MRKGDDLVLVCEYSSRDRNQLIMVSRGGVLEDVLGLEDTFEVLGLEDTFEVLGIDLVDQVLGFGLEASSPQKLPCSRL